MAKYLRIGGQVPLLNPSSGEVELHPEAKAKRLIKEGWEPETSGGFEARREAERYDSPVVAAGAGLARGLTLGLSDAAFRAAGGDWMAEDLRKLQEYNPGASLAGDLAGAAGGAFMGPLALVGRGAGAVGRLASEAVAGGAQTGLRALAGRAAGTLARGAVEGGAMGAGQGVSDVALADREMEVAEALRAIGSRTVAGAAVGAAFSAAGAGMGVLARFAKKQAKGLAELSELTGKRKVLTAEQDALKEKLEAAGVEVTAEGATGAVKGLSREAGRYQRVTHELEQLQERLGKNQSGHLGQLVQAIAERKGQQMIGAGVGTVLGGFPGMVVGAILSPHILDVAKRAIVPLGRLAGRTATSAEGVAASRTAAALWSVSKQEAIRALSSSEFLQLSDELDAASTGAPEALMLASDAPEPIKRAIADHEAKRVAFLREKLDQVAPSRAVNPLRPVQRTDPGAEGRIRLARYCKGAMDPESVLDDFASGRMTPEGREALARLYPGDFAGLTRMIQADVRLHLARGGVFSAEQENQLSLLLGMPSSNFGLGPLVLSQGSVQGEPQQARVKPPKMAAAERVQTRIDRLLS